MADLRVGVVGTGWVAAARHIPAFRRAAGAEVVAVCDRRIERSRELAGRLGIPGAFSDVDELLGYGLDIVSICTPPWTHAEMACAALARGIHVFTEKPMAMNEAEARAMVDAARAGGVELCVSHNLLFSRSVRKAERLLARSGGGVRYAAGIQLSSFARRLPTWYGELPGGLLLDECPHLLYTLQHFLGPLAIEHARFGWDAGVAGGGGEPSSVELLVRGPRGPGQVTMVFASPVSEWHVALVGPGMVVDLDLFRDITMSARSDGAHRPLDILRTSAVAVGGHAAGFAASGARYAARRQFWGHDALIAAFVAAVRAGRPAPVPAGDALSVVRLADDLLSRLAADRP